MIILHYKLSSFLRRFGFYILCNVIDALFLFQGNAIRLQLTMIVFYRWVLYTPHRGDFAIFIIFGFFWDIIYHLPFGFHSFLTLIAYVVLHTQKRYLQVSQQYVRWLLFLGVLVLYYQFEYALHYMLGQKIVLSSKLLFSMLVTFSLYPYIFRFLQHYDR